MTRYYIEYDTDDLACRIGAGVGEGLIEVTPTELRNLADALESEDRVAINYILDAMCFH